ncbi:hypothetical protein J7E96_23900 [Streptomyces sp. ISL-96]|uniref:hypothetical protein n=1 Tax=Streptomyces sp. ISL-96 TaxID=2819191 RepID=UPI001BE9012D|nr:hypothetical protein [Streptomyces sp. ISL-96]MBT2491513.1 hypothetical protein [Streptomyces sp. ISL-96]
MGGFEVLVDVAQHNAEAAEKAWHEVVEGERREGIPVELWRALPDSDADGN